MATWNGNYSTTEHDEYTEVNVHSGQLQITLDNGDVLENIHFDCSPYSSYVTIVDQLGWHDPGLNEFTIRNVAYTGGHPQGAVQGMSIATSGYALIENVYMGDGAVDYPVTPSSHHNYPGGIIARPGNTGTLHFKGVYTENWCDNAMYCSPPGSPGSGQGTIRIENCFSRNNIVSCYRFGTDDELINSYGEIEPGNQRIIWVFYGIPSADLQVEDCELLNNGGAHAIRVGSGGTCRVRNSSFSDVSAAGNFIDQGGNDRNPQTFVPAGCPTTPEEAYLGEPGGGGGSPSPPSPDPDPPEEIESLDPVNPGSYSSTGVVRGLTQDSNCEVEMWFDTDDLSEFEWTEDYGAALDWTELVRDSEHNNRLRAACSIYDRDTNDQEASGDIPPRKAFRTNASIVAVRFNEANFDLELDPDGEARIEMDGEEVDTSELPTTPNDPPPEPEDPSIDTGNSTNITTNSVVLHGQVNALGEHSALDVGFRVRSFGDDNWPVEGPMQTISSETDIEQQYPTEDGFAESFITEDSRYEYELWATDGAGDTWRGGVRSFTTARDPSDPIPEEPGDPVEGSLWYVDHDDFDDD